MILSKLFEWRKFSLPFAGVVFHLLKFNPFRCKQIWLFGCWMGEKFDDNSKFLFEYVCKNHPEIRCIWITRKASVCEQVQSLGYECYISSSLKGVLYMLRGGVAIMTNGLDDFSRIPFIGGAKIVALWHGVGGFKKIYNENYSGLKLRLKKMTDFFFSWTHRDISLGTSEYTAECVMEQFGGARDSIIITGQPRNDLFRDENIDRKAVLEDLLDADYAKVVLYMPTYRVNPKTQKDVVKEILETLVSSLKFLAYLKQNSILFLTKLHPLTKFSIDVPIKNFKILDDKKVASVQHLLKVSDCLVTDYSSCCVDYALLHRPIVFFVPDETDYLSYFAVNDAYAEVVQEKAKNVDELVNLLTAGKIEQANLLNSIFEDDSISGTCYCENTYKGICEKCKVGIQ